MNKTKLSKAITMALAGSAISVMAITNVSAHTMYNTYSNDGLIGPSFANDTDGWMYTDGSHQGQDAGSSFNEWKGTTGGVRPFGYAGRQAVNWAAMVHSVGQTIEISNANAQSAYGLDADIDTAKGAWSDGAQGWAHNTDYGLFKSMVDAKITLTPSTTIDETGANADWNNFGLTVFTGMDDGTGQYSHHSNWNSSFVPFTASNPHGTNGVDYLTHSESGSLEFDAVAGQIYSVYLGGNSGPGNFGPHAGYSLGIEASPVPVPGAVWLMGSGLIGLIGYGRRKI